MNGFAKYLADLLRPLPRSVDSVPSEAHPTPPPAKKDAGTLLRETNERTIARLKEMEGDPAKLLEARLATFTPEKRAEIMAALAKGPTGPLEPGHYHPGPPVSLDAHRRFLKNMGDRHHEAKARSVGTHPLMGAPYGNQRVEINGQVCSVPQGYSVRETGDGWFEAVSPEGALSAQCPSVQEAASLCFEHRNTALPADRLEIPIRTNIEFAPSNFLIFINGDPRSGKDTTSFAIEAAFKERGYFAIARSSIEPVREMLQNAGFDLSAKTEKDRFLLAEVGDRVEEHSDFRSNAAIQTFRDLARKGREKNTPVALVLHTREPATMYKIAFGLRNEMNLSIKALFVSGRGMAVTSNKADAGVRGMVYDDEIRNDGTLAELESRVDSLVGSWTS